VPDETNRVFDVQALDQFFQRFRFFAIACKRERDGLAVGP